MGEDFEPRSTDAMFARLIAEAEADRQARADFREAVLARFDDGAARMDSLGVEIAAVKEQTTKTNGRVSKLEARERQLLAKLAGARLVLGALAWAMERGWVTIGR